MKLPVAAGLTMAALTMAALTMLPAQKKRVDFSGNWSLDLKKSVNLPPAFRGVESYVIGIAQAGDSLTVVTTMKGGGRETTLPPYLYLVDGRESHRLDSLRGSERWMTARWGADGKSVLMDTRVSMKAAGQPPTLFTQHDVWKRVDGTLIDIAITQKFGDSVRTERRIFRKLK